MFKNIKLDIFDFSSPKIIVNDYLSLIPHPFLSSAISSNNSQAKTATPKL